MLPVSFFIVIIVVVQGQCIRKNTMTQTAVTGVQPLWVRSTLSSAMLPSSARLPEAVYAIIMAGSTISLAGEPRIKAMSIVPSMPKKRAAGSRKSVHKERSEDPPTVIFARHQIISPAGAAITTARPRTKRVLSKTERTITLPICGRRKAGSSRAMAEGIPRRMVEDKSPDTRRVIITLKTTNRVSIHADSREPDGAPGDKVKNMVIIAISAGKPQPF